MSEHLQCGALLPQFGTDYRLCRDAPRKAEALGYDSLWIADHLFGVPLFAEKVIAKLR